MIKSFGNKETEKIWQGEYSKKYPTDIQAIARRKLRMINSAQDLNDLRVPPGNRLEKLKGDLESYWSIRINSQWRIIFEWIDNDAHLVQIIDYH
jgi:proteic killer suppression protein